MARHDQISSCYGRVAASVTALLFLCATTYFARSDSATSADADVTTEGVATSTLASAPVPATALPGTNGPGLLPNWCSGLRVQSKRPAIPDISLCKTVNGPLRSVVAVLSGDTLRLDDGSELRLAGVLAPEMPAGLAAPSRENESNATAAPGLTAAASRTQPAASATATYRSGMAAREGDAEPSLPGSSATVRHHWRAAQAARRALADLVAGRSVRLRYDGDRRDRYGRIMAHLILVDADERAARGPATSGVWVQAQMVAAGHLRAVPSPAHPACAGILLPLEHAARTARCGLWSQAAYQIRASWKTRELLRYRHRFELIEGVVQDVAVRGGRAYLNFGKRWQDDFTAVVSGRPLRALQDGGLPLTRLKGRRVRVRGWLERSNGPLVRIDHPAQIELVSPGSGAGRSRKSRREP